MFLSPIKKFIDRCLFCCVESKYQVHLLDMWNTFMGQRNGFFGTLDVSLTYRDSSRSRIDLEELFVVASVVVEDLVAQLLVDASIAVFGSNRQHFRRGCRLHDGLLVGNV